MMFEDMQVLIGTLKGLEHSALWVLFGFLGFTLAKLYGGGYLILRIVRYIYDWAVTKKVIYNTEVVTVKLEDRIISDKDFSTMILSAFDLVKTRESSHGYKYLHDDDCKWLLDAVKEKLLAEKA